jgi:hypothetical protein
MQSVFKLSIIKISVVLQYNDIQHNNTRHNTSGHYAKCLSAEYHYDKFRSAECRGALYVRDE